MSALPPIPRPPHDPTSLLCNARLGWPLLRADDVVISDGTLTLARNPGSLRWLTEPSGSFGGLRLPANVAFGSGALWLLGISDAVLRRLDPCACAFVDVPCFGGIGSGPRQLRNPSAIAVGANRMYVSDTGNGRLTVLSLPGFELVGHWTIGIPWQPSGVLLDALGVVVVVDPQNGMLHRFTPYGTYLGGYRGYGASRFLALDREGTIYAASADGAYRVGSAGAPAPVEEPADDLGLRFTPMPAAVDPDGRMALGAVCTPPSRAVFDIDGRAVAEPRQVRTDRFMRFGQVIIGPLDSRIDHCVWHRLAIIGQTASGSLTIETHTSELALTLADLDDLAADGWSAPTTCLGFDDGQWDALVISPPGRHLWLRLTITGDGRASPALDAIEVEFPRISLRRFMPAAYGAEPSSADFTDRFLALFDRSLRDTERAIDMLARLFDPMATPSLPWLAGWIGEVPDRQLPEDLQRRLVARSSASTDIRGTRIGMWQLLLSYLGLDRLVGTCGGGDAASAACRPRPTTCAAPPPPENPWQPPPLILEHYRLRRWLELGAGRLGDQAVLWGKRIVNRSQLGDNAQVGITQLNATQDPLRDPFHVYANKFTVFVPAAAGATATKRRSLERLIAREKPAHTAANVEYVEPRMRIGFQSMIGLDAVVARLPESGVTLGATALGPASILTGNIQPRASAARIGTTATLETPRR